MRAALDDARQCELEPEWVREKGLCASMPACLDASMPASFDACMPRCLHACPCLPMPACLDACMPRCLHACMPPCLHASMPPCLPMPACMDACMPACLDASMPACLHAWMSAYLRESLCVSMPPCHQASMPPCIHGSMPLCLRATGPPCLYVFMPLNLHVRFFPMATELCCLLGRCLVSRGGSDERLYALCRERAQGEGPGLRDAWRSPGDATPRCRPDLGTIPWTWCRSHGMTTAPSRGDLRGSGCPTGRRL